MYLIINEHKMLTKNAFWFHERLIGLTFRKKLKYAMLFKHTNSVHTFFMKVNIDIVALNEENVVIFKAVDVPKNKIITVKNKVKNTSILELPRNTSKYLKIGQKIIFTKN